MDKIIVLMATYNGEKYLQEQIDTILAQKDVDVELVVRDDGSTDRTKEILEENHRKGKLDWYTGEKQNLPNLRCITAGRSWRMKT